MVSTATTTTTTMKSKHGSSTKKKKKKKQQKQQEHEDSSRIDTRLVEKAITALLKHHESETAKQTKHSLLGNDTAVQLQIGLEVAPDHARPKPIRIPIPHPIYNVSNSDGDSDGDDDEEGLDIPEVCLIVKEDAKEWVQEQIAAHPQYLRFVKKVLGLESLRKKHAQYAQRRALIAKYGIFMADDRIITMLPQCLGRDCVRVKKLPIPIDITRREALPLAIYNILLGSTFMTRSTGTCVTIKIGSTCMSADKLVANTVAAAVAACPQCHPVRKWANIRSISVKTTDSMALPIYNKTPAQLLEIAALAGIEPMWKEITAEEEAATKREKEETERAINDKKKRKDAAKSPLVRALQKQKNEKQHGVGDDGEERSSSGADDNAQSSSKQKKQKKKDRKRKSSLDGEEGNTNDQEKGGDEVIEEEEPVKKRSKKKEKVINDDAEKSPASSSSKTKDIDTDEKKKKKFDEKFAGDGASASPYVASKKYRGTQPGYIFQMGREGLGYYRDVQPVVDEMAMEAILRSAQRGRGGGSSQKKKSKRSSSGSSGKKRGRGGRR